MSNPKRNQLKEETISNNSSQKFKIRQIKIKIKKSYKIILVLLINLRLIKNNFLNLKISKSNPNKIKKNLMNYLNLKKINQNFHKIRMESHQELKVFLYKVLIISRTINLTFYIMTLTLTHLLENKKKKLKIQSNGLIPQKMTLGKLLLRCRKYDQRRIFSSKAQTQILIHQINRKMIKIMINKIIFKSHRINKTTKNQKK